MIILKYINFIRSENLKFPIQNITTLVHVMKIALIHFKYRDNTFYVKKKKE